MKNMKNIFRFQKHYLLQKRKEKEESKILK